MKATYKTAPSYRLFAAILALTAALSLAVPAHARDAWLEPDGFTSEVSPTVSDNDATTPSGR